MSQAARSLPTGFDTLASDNPINSQSQDDTNWIQPGNTWSGSELYRISSADMLQNAYIRVSRSFPRRACSNDDHALKRLFLYLHLVFEIWFSKFSKILKVKRNISGAKKVTWKLFFRLFFQYFFSPPSEGHRTPSILCIYSYKKENIPEQGKKFFSPWKWKFACTFPMNRARCILWIKYLKRLSFELYHWFDRFEAWWWKK